ncbi:MAG: FtsX-like permease family protein [Bacteroidota bacterium]
MLKNYLTTAWRNLSRQPIFATINVIGLAIGLAAVYLMTLFIWDEYRMNDWVKNANRHYFIESDWKAGRQGLEIVSLTPMGRSLQENYPHLVANHFTVHARSCNVSVPQLNKSFRLDLQVFDGDFLNSYGIPLLHGNASTAFDEPSGIVIQHDVAQKFFGKTDVIGEELVLETENAEYDPVGKKTFMITGVIDKLPENSITDNLGDRTDIYIGSDNVPYYGPVDMWNRWDVDIVQTRIELRERVSPEDLIEPMAELVQNNAPDYLANFMIPKLTALSTYNIGQNDQARGKMINILIAITIFILLVAIMNFINISLGMASKRMKEIGVRKVIGGVRQQIMFQFLSEALLFTVLAALLALCIVQLTQQEFALLVNKPHLFSNTTIPLLYPLFGGLAILIGLLAGMYPSIVLACKPTLNSLKGKESIALKKVDLKKVLLSFQFFIALFIVMTSMVVSDQLNFFLNKDLGYESKNIVTVTSLPRWWSEEGVQKMLSLKEEFKSIPEVKSGTLSFEIPDGRYGQTFDFSNPEKAIDEFYTFPVISCDAEYAESFDLELVEGRFLNKDDGNNELKKVVLTEKAAYDLFEDQPVVGNLIRGRDTLDYEVVGIVRDFNFGSLHNPIQGLAFTEVTDPLLYRYFSFQLRADGYESAIAKIEQKWNLLFNDVPFEYVTIEDKIQSLYESERQFKSASTIAALLSIAVMTIGLFGVTMQGAAKRTKEIGVRKVLGASGKDIIKLLSKEYMWQIALATLLVVPLSYLVSEKWLSNFAYRIDQSWHTYAAGVFAIAIIVAFTISWELLKAALKNPADSIRHE